MGKAFIVLGPARLQMVDQMLPRFWIEAGEVFGAEGAEQQLGLVKPRGVDGRVEQPAGAGAARSSAGCHRRYATRRCR